MSDDEKFDMWVQNAARDYNAPPEHVPREEMWNVIRAASGERRAEPHGAPILSIAGRRSLVAAFAVAAAAVLVVVSYQVGKTRGAVSAPPVVATSTTAAPHPDSALYAQATEQHLGRADALLTSVRSEVATGSMDPAVQKWARELLVDTRLLLDSPAASEPARRRLLQDLELTLAQIVQLSAASTPDDQRMVERQLERGELLTRIRTAVPSALSGT